jgi:biopolymer transport protein ExbD
MISAGDGGGQDFELNLASIIDCLTVIIAFLLMSSSFVSFGAMDTAVAVPQAGAPATPSSDDSKSVTLTVKLVGEDKVEWEVTSGPDARAREKKTLARAGLLGELEGAKTRYPGLQGVVLSAAPRIPYQQLIQAMDDTRKVFPAVILGVSGG